MICAVHCQLARYRKLLMESRCQLQHTANESIHAAHISEVHMVPMNVILRPILPVLDDLKVQSLMQTITEVCFVTKHA